MTEAPRSRRLPPLTALKAFEAAARLGNFSRAAAELGVTPGAVSQQMRLLEEHLGVELFERRGRDMIATEPARAALAELRQGFDLMARAAQTMRAASPRRRLLVAAPAGFAAKWLAPRVDRFDAVAPDIDLWLTTEERGADLIWRYGPEPAEPGFAARRLLGESVTPMGAPRWFEGPEAIETPADLRRATLLHDAADDDPDCPDWTAWLAAHQIDGAESARGPRFSAGYLALEAAIAGRGLVLAKRALAQADLISGRLVAPFAQGARDVGYGYWLLAPVGAESDPRVLRFIDWASAQARDFDASLGQL